MKRSGLAIWSFVLVLVAYFFISINILFTNLFDFDVFSIIATIFSFTFWLAGAISFVTFILGIVALNKIKKKGEGKNLAIATIVLSAIVIIFFLYILYGIYQLAKGF